MSETHLSGIFEHISDRPFDLTLQLLTKAIADAGLILFSTVDHQAGARQVGLDMPATRLLTYGHPKGGTPVMLAVPLVALELPLRVLVRDIGDGRTAVAFHPIGPVLRQAGVPEALAGSLDAAQRLLIKALA